MIDIQHLRFGYAKPLLHIDALKLKEGEHLLVQGPSGCGKTSLLFLLAGLLQPQAGAINIEGIDITSLKAAARDLWRGKAVGFIFQQPHLITALTALENVLMVPFMGGVPADSLCATQMLEKIGLKEQIHRYPSALSYGQMQRVGVARALVHKPRLVLADEPTSALDDEACEATIRLLLKSAREAGAQLVVASHDARLKKHFGRVMNLGGK